MDLQNRESGELLDPKVLTTFLLNSAVTSSLKLTKQKSKSQSGEFSKSKRSATSMGFSHNREQHKNYR